MHRLKQSFKHLDLPCVDQKQLALQKVAPQHGGQQRPEV
jgi:hypothetical protein